MCIRDRSHLPRGVRLIRRRRQCRSGRAHHARKPVLSGARAGAARHFRQQQHRQPQRFCPPERQGHQRRGQVHHGLAALPHVGGRFRLVVFLQYRRRVRPAEHLRHDVSVYHPRLRQGDGGRGVRE